MLVYSLNIIHTGYPQHSEKTENGPTKNRCQGKHREFESIAKTQVCTHCKFPDSTGKGYCDICHDNFNFFQKLDRSVKSVLCM